MSQSTIAIIILIVTFILYAIPKMPLSVVTILAMLSMAIFKIINYTQAFSGFSNSVIFLVAGLMIIGKASITTGLAPKIGKLLGRGKLGTNETWFIGALFVVSCFISVFINASLTVAILMPVIDAVAIKSEGRITRKGTYMALGISSVLGNNVLTISATSMLTAVGLLEASGYGRMSLFAPVAINLPSVIVVFIFYILFGKKLQDKWFDFSEQPLATTAGEKTQKEEPLWKQALVAIVLVVVVIALIGGANFGMAALLGAAVLILAGCISEGEALKSVSWGTIIIVAGSIGFSSGIQASGAGDIIANFFINISGPLGKSGLGLCVVLFIVSSLMSNAMSDNATVAIVLPIAMAIATTTQLNPAPLFLAACSGTKVALATPICVAPMSQVIVAGYRFKDYLRMGGVVNLMCLVISCIAIAFIYY
jgi:di/tricarboxylate transporter